MKDGEIAKIVNELRDIATQYHDTQQLRERIAGVVVPLLKQPDHSGDRGAPADCSGTPESCPDNEGYGCHCGTRNSDVAAPVPQDGDERAREWVGELRRAHVYLDQGKPFFSGRDCAELADLIEGLASSKAAAAAVGERLRLKSDPQRTGVGQFCQPGDRREPRWLIMYDDADRTHSIFEDEQDAREAFANSEGVGWNCWLFSPTPRATPPTPIASAEEAAPVAALTVWYGSMPESNGKTNWTAILHNGDIASGMTIDQSEYPERVRYAADRVRWLIGDLDKEPWILDYDADKHSGYTHPAAAQPATAEVLTAGQILSLRKAAELLCGMGYHADAESIISVIRSES